MQIFIYILIGAVGAMVAHYLLNNHKVRTIEKFSGMALGEVNKKSHLEKENRKGKIMSLFANQETITNNQVEKLLEVSDSTATRYLDELEQDGKITQEGVGSRTVYRKK